MLNNKAGFLLYGYDSAGRLSADLEPVLSVEAEIVQVKSIAAGTRVGYGGRWVAERPSRIGIVPRQRARVIAQRLLASDMFSGWGIRTLSAAHPFYNPKGEFRLQDPDGYAFMIAHT